MVTRVQIICTYLPASYNIVNLNFKKIFCYWNYIISISISTSGSSVMYGDIFDVGRRVSNKLATKWSFMKREKMKWWKRKEKSVNKTKTDKLLPWYLDNNLICLHKDVFITSVHTIQFLNLVSPIVQTSVVFWKALLMDTTATFTDHKHTALTDVVVIAAAMAVAIIITVGKSWNTLMSILSS